MSSDVFLDMAYRAFEPVICFIMLLLIVVSYTSCIATSIACCITSVVKDMSSDVFLDMAYRAFEPVVIFIILLLIIVSYASCITTCITGCVAGVVKDVGNLIFLLTTINALKPVIYIIMLVSITKIMLITFKWDKCAIIFFRICLGSRAFIAINGGSFRYCI